MKFQCYYRLAIFDADGNVVRTQEAECKSFIRQIIDLMYIQFRQTSYSIKDISGGTTARGPAYANGRASAAYGPIIGTGATPVTISDYALDSMIADGSGAGQMVHGFSAVSMPTTPVSGTRSNTIERAFTNNSGSQITVAEIGLTVRVISTYLVIRDVLVIPEPVNDSSGLSLTYDIRVVV